MTERNPWKEVDEREHGPQPGVIQDCWHGVEDLYDTDPDDSTPSFPDDDSEELNVYDEADDDLEDEEDEEDER